jgi:hypothetical protein
VQRSPKAKLTTFALVSIVLAVLLACKALGKPEEGKDCDKEGEIACASPTSMLACQAGAWRAFPCAGQNGCTAKGGKKAVCDMSGNEAGAACAKIHEKVDVCAGSKAMVQCTDGKIVKHACGGKNGCALGSDNKPHCDQSISAAGSACFAEGKSACSTDQKKKLRCKNGAWAATDVCRGAKGCWVDSEKNLAYCDMSLAYISDPCSKDGDWACALDGRSQLTCRNGKYAYGQRCYGKGGCEVTPKDKGMWTITCN